MSEEPQSIFEILESRLPDRELLSINDIVKAGFCRSPNTVWKLLKSGVLPSLRISRNTTLIPRAAILDHIKKSYNLSVNG
jgi:hypothetical protein